MCCNILGSEAWTGKLLSDGRFACVLIFHSPRLITYTLVLYQAPIIPHVSASDDTRHFSDLPLPPARDIPGLLGLQGPSALGHPLLSNPSADEKTEDHLFLDF